MAISSLRRVFPDSTPPCLSYLAHKCHLRKYRPICITDNGVCVSECECGCLLHNDHRSLFRFVAAPFFFSVASVRVATARSALESPKGEEGPIASCIGKVSGILSRERMPSSASFEGMTPPLKRLARYLSYLFPLRALFE